MARCQGGDGGCGVRALVLARVETNGGRSHAQGDTCQEHRQRSEIGAGAVWSTDSSIAYRFGPMNPCSQQVLTYRFGQAWLHFADRNVDKAEKANSFCSILVFCLTSTHRDVSQIANALICKSKRQRMQSDIIRGNLGFKQNQTTEPNYRVCLVLCVGTKSEEKNIYIYHLIAHLVCPLSCLSVI